MGKKNPAESEEPIKINETESYSGRFYELLALSNLGELLVE